jgi:hypothetical protein
VAEGDGQGVAVADGLADPLADGVEDGLGLALELALPEGEGLAVAAGAQLLGATVGASSVWLPPVAAVLPPSRSRAAGTTSRPRMTVITKASAPHSWSQKARDELRIRGRRPVRAEACCAY